jgi:VWFA-related protein
MVKFIARTLVILTALAAAAGISLSQKPGRAPAPPQKEQAPVMRVTTRLVQVGVVVHDRSGQPVAGLQKEDFVLLEAGKEQTISEFSVEVARAAPPEAKPLPPDTFSNLAQFRSGTPANLSVILLDSINTLIQDQSYARQRIIKFLEQLRPEDRVALYVLTEYEILVLQDFTQDVNRLLSSLQRYKGRISSALDASEPVASDTGFDGLDSFVRRGDERIANYYSRERVLKTAAALEAIAHHLAHIPGRKNLIWVSAGFPISFGEQAVQSYSSPIEQRSLSDLNRNPRGKASASSTPALGGDPRAASVLSPERGSFYPQVERAARAVTDANIAVYPVDARGLLGAVMPGAQRLPTSGAYPAREGLTSLDTQAGNIDSMQVLAERTGGLAFFHTNDLETAIRRAMDDSQVTYLLGFYPTHGRWDGSFREIKVRVNRPSVRVRSRSGYFALAEQADDEMTRRKLLGEAARSPLDATGVGLTARVNKVVDDVLTKLAFSVSVEARDLTLEQQGQKWVGGVDAIFVQLTADGRLIDTDTTEVKMDLDEERFRQIKKEGLVIHKTVEWKPGAVTVRVVVRDALSGSIGSLAVPLDQFAGQAAPTMN